MTLVNQSTQEMSHWTNTDTVVKGGGVRKGYAGTTPDQSGIPVFVEQISNARAKRTFGIDSNASYRAVVDIAWVFAEKDIVQVSSGEYLGKKLLIENIIRQEGSDTQELGLRDTPARPDL